MFNINTRLIFLLFSIAIIPGCGGSTGGPVEIAPMTQTPTSDFPVGKEPVLAEEGP